MKTVKKIILTIILAIFWNIHGAYAAGGNDQAFVLNTPPGSWSAFPHGHVAVVGKVTGEEEDLFLASNTKHGWYVFQVYLNVEDPRKLLNATTQISPGAGPVVIGLNPGHIHPAVGSFNVVLGFASRISGGGNFSGIAGLRIFGEHTLVPNTSGVSAVAVLKSFNNDQTILLIDPKRPQAATQTVPGRDPRRR